MLKRAYILESKKWEGQLREALENLGVKDIGSTWADLWNYIDNYMVPEIIRDHINNWNASYINNYFEHSIRVKQIDALKRKDRELLANRTRNG
jgi:hypothetical protein